jgi:O-methyltransferase
MSNLRDLAPGREALSSESSKKTTRPPNMVIPARRHADGRNLALKALPGAQLPPFTEHYACRFLYQKRLLDQLAQVEGDIVECGVGRGFTLLLWSILASRGAPSRRIWAFDSFEGFPDPTPEDASPRKEHRGEWAVTTLPAVHELLLASGLSAEWLRAHVSIVKGFFDQSLRKYTGDKIALLYIDVDLYASYRVVLDALYPKVVENGIVALDEYQGTWEHYDFPGARRAVDEFLATKNLHLQHDPDFGKYYFVKSSGGR